MGRKMAPTYANLFMGHLEEQMLEQTTLKHLLWFRFIEDIFFLWTVGQINLSSMNSVTNLTHTLSSNKRSQPQASPFLMLGLS